MAREDEILAEFVKLEPKTPVIIETIDGNKFNCFFMEINSDLSIVNVQNWETPLGKLGEAAIRMVDIESITINF